MKMCFTVYREDVYNTQTQNWCMSEDKCAKQYMNIYLSNDFFCFCVFTWWDIRKMSWHSYVHGIFHNILLRLFVCFFPLRYRYKNQKILQRNVWSCSSYIHRGVSVLINKTHHKKFSSTDRALVERVVWREYVLQINLSLISTFGVILTVWLTKLSQEPPHCCNFNLINFSSSQMNLCEVHIII